MKNLSQQISPDPQVRGDLLGKGSLLLNWQTVFSFFTQVNQSEPYPPLWQGEPYVNPA